MSTYSTESRYNNNRHALLNKEGKWFSGEKNDHMILQTKQYSNSKAAK